MGEKRPRSGAVGEQTLVILIGLSSSGCKMVESNGLGMGNLLVLALDQLQKELRIDKLSRPQKRMLVGVLVLGVPTGSYFLKNCVRRVRKEQKLLWTAVNVKSASAAVADEKKKKTAEASSTVVSKQKEGKEQKGRESKAAQVQTKGKGGKKRVAVDAVFFERLCKI